MSAGPELPSGTVTFLFTDIEGSTRLLKRLRTDYGRVVAEHRELLLTAILSHGGMVVDAQGDSFFVVFRRAKAAVDAAVAAQRALAEHVWPDGGEVRVRMGIHTGQAEASDGRYHGLAVHRAARIGDAGHGGQVLVSQTTRDLLDDEEEEAAGVTLRDLGEQRLKDLDRPVRLYQLEIDVLSRGFPPLRTGAPKQEELAAEVGSSLWSRRLRRRFVAPVAVAVVLGAVAVGVLLTRAFSTSAQASAGVAADSVGVFNAKNGKLITQAAVRTGPSAVAVGEGAIWVTNVDDDSVSRIDPKTNASIQTISVGKGPDGVAVGGGFVWVANGLDGTVSKIDPSTNTVVQTVTVGNGPSGVAYGEGAVWVANSTDRTVMRIDPGTGKPGREFPAGAGADGLAVGDGAVWVTSESAGTVTRIDPRAGIVTQPINVGRGAHAVAVGPGAVWVANGLDGTVSRVDPVSSDVRATVTVGDGPTGVAVSADGKSVWVSSEIAGTLSQIVGDKVVRAKTTGNRPQDVAISGDTMYVAVRTSGLAHRGGTLTILANDPFDSIDPAVAWNLASWRAIILTNDGLVTFRRVGGSNGARLVPDLARSIPTPTDGGTTYTFQVRTGIQYSNGVVVRPADFRRGIERALANPGGYGPTFLTGVVGAARCVKIPKRCDLSRGIVTDSASNTITFRLTAPDPDFLIKLASPAAYAVPARTLLRARLPVPATGPYMIASYDAKRGARLVRNPRFHAWYRAAQPDGYPDEIIWRFKVLPDAQRRAVEQGKADLAVDAGSANDGGFPSSSLIGALRSRYDSQLHFNPLLNTFFVFLNTRLPPFNDVRVRRAVNYAVDRNRMVDLRGGPDLVQPSCQVLPPNLDGYRRYCPYTRDPSPNGKYTGPDLQRARRLVAASGTSGQEVTVAGIAGIFQPHGGNYFVSVLRDLGYRARFKNFKDAETYFRTAADSREKIQAGITGWAEDYPSAGNWFPILLTCRSFIPRSHANLNFAGFCDRRIDAEITRARLLQITDPGAASRLWNKIDRDIVDRAPWVVLQNPLELDFVSRRVGNYQYNPVWGALLDQLWVK